MHRKHQFSIYFNQAAYYSTYLIRIANEMLDPKEKDHLIILFKNIL